MSSLRTAAAAALIAVGTATGAAASAELYKVEVCGLTLNGHGMFMTGNEKNFDALFNAAACWREVNVVKSAAYKWLEGGDYGLDALKGVIGSKNTVTARCVATSNEHQTHKVGPLEKQVHFEQMEFKKVRKNPLEVMMSPGVGGVEGVTSADQVPKIKEEDLYKTETPDIGELMAHGEEQQRKMNEAMRSWTAFTDGPTFTASFEAGHDEKSVQILVNDEDKETEYRLGGFDMSGKDFIGVAKIAVGPESLTGECVHHKLYDMGKSSAEVKGSVYTPAASKITGEIGVRLTKM